jgi:hypothetical protein
LLRRGEIMKRLSRSKQEELRKKIAEHREQTRERIIENSAQEGGVFFAYERTGVKKGVLGGLIMIAIAVTWFLVGLAIGYVFFYPAILFIIGLYAFLKGAVTGNLKGESKDK